jgi:hypothetical protein
MSRPVDDGRKEGESCTLHSVLLTNLVMYHRHFKSWPFTWLDISQTARRVYSSKMWYEHEHVQLHVQMLNTGGTLLSNGDTAANDEIDDLLPPAHLLVLGRKRRRSGWQ